MTPTTPDPGRVRLEGTLDAVRASDRTFTLRLDDGRDLPGRLVRGGIAGLGRVLGRRLLVFGTARLGPAGELVGVEADGYIPNDGKPWRRPKADPPASPEVAAEVDRRMAELRRTRPELFARTIVTILPPPPRSVTGPAPEPG